jgi:hypothetical protein
MGWAQRGNQIARQIDMTRAFTVPEDLTPRLLELWDISGTLVPHSSNKPLTEHARIVWTARKFCAEHQGAHVRAGVRGSLRAFGKCTESCEAVDPMSKRFSEREKARRRKARKVADRLLGIDREELRRKAKQQRVINELLKRIAELEYELASHV